MTKERGQRFSSTVRKAMFRGLAIGMATLMFITAIPTAQVMLAQVAVPPVPGKPSQPQQGLVTKILPVLGSGQAQTVKPGDPLYETYRQRFQTTLDPAELEQAARQQLAPGKQGFIDGQAIRDVLQNGKTRILGKVGSKFVGAMKGSLILVIFDSFTGTYMFIIIPDPVLGGFCAWSCTTSPLDLIYLVLLLVTFYSSPFPFPVMPMNLLLLYMLMFLSSGVIIIIP